MSLSNSCCLLCPLFDKPMLHFSKLSLSCNFSVRKHWTEHTRCCRRCRQWASRDCTVKQHSAIDKENILKEVSYSKTTLSGKIKDNNGRFCCENRHCTHRHHNEKSLGGFVSKETVNITRTWWRERRGYGLSYWSFEIYLYNRTTSTVILLSDIYLRICMYDTWIFY